jgi:hypothetical protein
MEQGEWAIENLFQEEREVVHELNHLFAETPKS